MQKNILFFLSVLHHKLRIFRAIDYANFSFSICPQLNTAGEKISLENYTDNLRFAQKSVPIFVENAFLHPCSNLRKSIKSACFRTSKKELAQNNRHSPGRASLVNVLNLLFVAIVFEVKATIIFCFHRDLRVCPKSPLICVLSGA
jgi:hypothetical protein